MLAFLDSAYFDDVVPVKTSPDPGVELVAVKGDDVVGIIDISIEGASATIDTVGVHPDHRREGIASRLLQDAERELGSAAITQIVAWTRDQESTLQWYRAAGFTEDSHYLHVYADSRADPAEPADAVTSHAGLNALMVFLHADLEDEDVLRRRFTRVHVCRRFSRPITTSL